MAPIHDWVTGRSGGREYPPVARKSFRTGARIAPRPEHHQVRDFNCRDNQVTRLRNEPSSGAATSVLVWIWVVRRSAVTVIGPAESGTLNVADRTPSFGRIGQAQVWVRCKPSRNRLPDGDAETRRQTKAQLPDRRYQASITGAVLRSAGRS